MEKETDPCISTESRIATIDFGLFPSNNLVVSLHKLEAPSSTTSDNNNGNAEDAQGAINPRTIAQAVETLTSNEMFDKFSFMDASRIMSLDHIAIAANTAMIRLSHFENNANAKENDNDIEGKRINSRGLALETMICAAGSTNVGSIMKDYAFDAKWEVANKTQRQTQDYHVLLLGCNVTEEEHMKIIAQVGLNFPETRKDMIEFFGRNRSEGEVTSLMKVYKIGKQEIISGETFSLEKAVLNRVATKFYT